MFRIFLLFFFIIISLTPLRAFSEESENNSINNKKVFTGKVQKILLDETMKLPGGEKQRQQLIQVKLSDGRVIETINNIPLQVSYQVILKKGDKIVLNEEDNVFYIEGFYRENICWILLGVFALLIVSVGGKKGLLALASLILKGSLLIFFLVPAIKSGYSPIIVASIFCIIGTFLTISLVSGWNFKTLAACIGTIGGVIISGFIGAWAVQATHLSGLLEPEMESIHYQFPAIRLSEMISAGVLIGSLGASMDVAISIASALHEVYLAAPGKKLLELYKIGMNIGKDVMGTMVNTLILAYAGSALPTIILISQVSAQYLMNMDLVVKEIILSIVGSIGLILTIPITALLSSYLFTSFKINNGSEIISESFKSTEEKFPLKIK